MSLLDNQKQDLIAYLPQVMNGEAKHYSRGLYCGICLGFVYDSEREAILDMIAVATYKNLDIDRKYLGLLFQSYQIDSLGQRIVLYFPVLKL